MGLPGRANQTCLTAMACALILSACNGSSSSNNDSGADKPPTAKARVATDTDDLLQGPLARGKEGDYVLENDLIRVIIQHEEVNDAGASQLARDIAKKLEEELEYPGQIKVTAIRETRAVEYAR